MYNLYQVFSIDKGKYGYNCILDVGFYSVNPVYMLLGDLVIVVMRRDIALT